MNTTIPVHFSTYRQRQNKNYTRDGRFFPDDLFYRYSLPGKTVLVCSKMDYFRFARDNGFAPEAKHRPEILKAYVPALAACIKAKAEKGYVFDEEESKGDFLVFKYADKERIRETIHNARNIANRALVV